MGRTLRLQNRAVLDSTVRAARGTFAARGTNGGGHVALHERTGGEGACAGGGQLPIRCGVPLPKAEVEAEFVSELLRTAEERRL